MKSHMRKLSVLVLALAMLALLVPLAAAQMTPGVTVSDQDIADGVVTVDSVVSSGPGWIVIHIDNNGAPGPVIGHTAVNDGENANVNVEIDASMATETLYAMLHVDAGQVGTYEFPGADTPAMVDGQMVTPAFKATGAAVMQPTEATTATAEAAATPSALPQTGGGANPWTGVALLALGALVLAGGVSLALAHRTW